MLHQLTDLFQNAQPQAIIGFCLFALFCLAGPVWLIFGGVQAFRAQPLRAQRRVLRARRRARR